MPDIEHQLKKASKKRSYKQNALAQPFLKWAGGKRQLLPAIKKYEPAQHSEYYEPFIEAGQEQFC